VRGEERQREDDREKREGNGMTCTPLSIRLFSLHLIGCIGSNVHNFIFLESVNTRVGHKRAMTNKQSLLNLSQTVIHSTTDLRIFPFFMQLTVCLVHDLLIFPVAANRSSSIHNGTFLMNTSSMSRH